jgi:hypothetical protein
MATRISLGSLRAQDNVVAQQGIGLVLITFTKFKSQRGECRESKLSRV